MERKKITRQTAEDFSSYHGEDRGEEKAKSCFLRSTLRRQDGSAMGVRVSAWLGRLLQRMNILKSEQLPH